ncbi:Thiol:disulfide interchange protein [Methylacidiphilum infernorum V4]|uniref:Thiol:disulfide interchange protein n=2 Tax=Candidatus Methylacidiphilum infernorum TaxID=511746 RepID=B3E0M4_METI4|nr:Thiol:disulfide interchange protein [Methylacidiphilum infernorum V4]
MIVMITFFKEKDHLKCLFHTLMHGINPKRLLFVLFLPFSLFFVQLGMAATSSSARSRHVEVSLLSELDAVSPGSHFYVALRMKMDEGWHTYWLNPGDAGSATKIDWTLPVGVHAGPIQWPSPSVISLPPLTSFGYEGECWLLIPMDISQEQQLGSSVNIKAFVQWVECAQSCLPGSAELNLTLPVESSPRVDESLKEGFQKAKYEIPRSPPESVSISFMDTGKNLIIFFQNKSGKILNFESAHFFPFQNGIIQYSAPQQLRLRKEGVSLEIARPSNNASALTEPLSGIFTAKLSGLKGIEKINWDIRARKYIPPKVETQKTGASPYFNKKFFSYLGLSFIGGLILNLMPCVLPVISLKVLNLVGAAKEGGGSSIAHGLSFVLGVLFSFWIVVGLLILLRQKGLELGWGFQLQSPPFVAFMALFFFLISLNLLGVYEIGVSLVSAQSLVEKAKGLLGSFLNGMLATLVASPCTAPFMGSAVGFALSQPPLVIILVFSSLALGMAFPVFVLSIFPGLLRLLPKPGPWMVSFKQFLAFPILGAVIWLIWVYGKLRGVDGVLDILLALLFVGLGSWIYGKFSGPFHPLGVRVLSILLSLAILLSSFYYVVVEIERSFSTKVAKKEEWVPFSESKLEEYLQQDVPVFVDFTASWCLTCQVNKKVALENPEVKKKFEELGVIRMEADWTNRDPKITEALESLGRSGVPTYVFYGLGSASPLLLPEVITPKMLLDVLNKIEKEKKQKEAQAKSGEFFQ